MKTIAISNNEDKAVIESVKPFLTKTGSLLPFKKYSEAVGADLEDKAERKQAHKDYDALVRQFQKSVAIGSAALRAQLPEARGRKLNIKFRTNKKTNEVSVIGWDESYRLPSAKKQAQDALAKIEACSNELTPAELRTLAASVQAKLDGMEAKAPVEVQATVEPVTVNA